MRIVRLFVLVIIMVAVGSGCVGVKYDTGYDKTMQQPLHAESGGTGITLWKVPVLGIGSWGAVGTDGLSGSGSGISSVIVHKYDYQVQPPSLAPDVPPSPPISAGPPPVDYKTIYESAWDDPTLVIFVNRSYRVIKIQIGDESEIKLAPYQATTNLHLTPGEYLIRKTVEKTVKLGAGAIFDWVTFFKINVTLDNRSQIFYLNEN